MRDGLLHVAQQDPGIQLAESNIPATGRIGAPEVALSRAELDKRC